MSANEGDSRSQEDDAQVYGYLLAMEDEGPGAKKIFGIGKSEIRIGRGSKNDIRLNARMFSRHHVTLTITKEDGIVKVNLQNLSEQKDATRAPYAIPSGSSVTLDSPSVFLLQNRRFHWMLNDGSIEAVQSQCKEPISYIMEGSQCSEDADENSLSMHNVVEYSRSPGTSKSRKSYSAPSSPSRKRRSSANTGLELRKAAIKGSFRSQQQNRPSSSMSILKEAMEKSEHAETSLRLSQSYDLITFSPESKADTSLPAAEKSDASLIDLRSFIASPVLDEGEESQSQTSNEDEHEIQLVPGSPNKLQDIPVSAGLELPVTKDAQSSTNLQIRSSTATPTRSTRSSISQRLTDTDVVAEAPLLNSVKAMGSPNFASPQKTRSSTPCVLSDEGDDSIIGLRSLLATPVSQVTTTPTTEQKVKAVTTPVPEVEEASAPFTEIKEAPTPVMVMNEVPPGSPNMIQDVPVSAGFELPVSRNAQSSTNLQIRSISATPKRSTRSSVSLKLTDTDVVTESPLLNSVKAIDSPNFASPQKTRSSTPCVLSDEGDDSIIGLRSLLATPVSQVTTTPTTEQKVKAVTTPVTEVEEAPVPEVEEVRASFPKKIQNNSSPTCSETPVTKDAQYSTNLQIRSSSATPKRATRSSVSQRLTDVVVESPLLNFVKAMDSPNFASPQKTRGSTSCVLYHEGDDSIIGLRSMLATPVSQVTTTPTTEQKVKEVTIPVPEVEEAPAPVPEVKEALAPVTEAEEAPTPSTELKQRARSPKKIQDNPLLTGSELPVTINAQCSTDLQVRSISATPKRSTRSSVSQRLTDVVAESPLLNSVKAIDSPNFASPMRTRGSTSFVISDEGDDSIIGLRSLLATPVSQVTATPTKEHKVKEVTTPVTEIIEASAPVPQVKEVRASSLIKIHNNPLPSCSEMPVTEDALSSSNLQVRSSSATPKRSTRSSVSQRLTNAVAESPLLNSVKAIDSPNFASPQKTRSSTPCVLSDESDDSIIGLRSLLATPVSQVTTTLTTEQKVKEFTTPVTEMKIALAPVTEIEEAPTPVTEVNEVSPGSPNMIQDVPVSADIELPVSKNAQSSTILQIRSISATPKRSTRSSVSQRLTDVVAESPLLNSVKAMGSPNFASPQKTRSSTPCVLSDEGDDSIIGLRSLLATPVSQVTTTPTTEQKVKAVTTPVTEVEEAPEVKKAFAPFTEIEEAPTPVTVVNEVRASSPKKIQDIAVSAGFELPVTKDAHYSTNLQIISCSATPKRLTRSSVSQRLTDVVAESSLLNSDKANDYPIFPSPMKTRGSTSFVLLDEGDDSIIGLRSLLATPVSQVTATPTTEQKVKEVTTPVTEIIEASAPVPQVDEVRASSPKIIQDHPVPTGSDLYASKDAQSSTNLQIRSNSATPKRSTRSSVTQRLTDVVAESPLPNSVKAMGSPNFASPQKTRSSTPCVLSDEGDDSIIGLRSLLATPVSRVTATLTTEQKAVTTPVPEVEEGPAHVREVKEASAPVTEIEEAPTPVMVMNEVPPGSPNMIQDVPVSAGFELPVSKNAQSSTNLQIRSISAIPKRSTRSSVSQRLTDAVAESPLLNSVKAIDSPNFASPMRTRGSTSFVISDEGDDSIIGLRSLLATPVSQVTTTPTTEQKVKAVTTPVPEMKVASAPVTEIEEAPTPVMEVKEVRASSPGKIQDIAVSAVFELPVSKDAQSSTNLQISSSATPKRSTRSSVSQGLTDVVAESSVLNFHKANHTPNIPSPMKTRGSTRFVLSHEGDDSIIGLRSLLATPVSQVTATPTGETSTSRKATTTSRAKTPVPVTDVIETKEAAIPAEITKKSRTRRALQITEEEAQIPVTEVKKMPTPVMELEEAPTPVPQVEEIPGRVPEVEEIPGPVPEAKEAPTRADVTKKCQTRRAPLVTEVEEAPTQAKETKTSRTRRAPLVTEEAVGIVEPQKRKTRGLQEGNDSVAETPTEITKKPRTRRAPSVTEMKEAPTSAEVTKKPRTRRDPSAEKVKDAPTPVEVTKKPRTRRAPSVTEMKEAPTPAEVTKKPRTQRAPSVTEMKEAPTPAEVTKKPRTRRAPSVTEMKAPTPAEVTKRLRTRRDPSAEKVKEAPTPVEVTKKPRTRRAPSVSEIKEALTPAKVTKKSQTQRAPSVTKVKEAPTLAEVTKKRRTRRDTSSENVKEAPTNADVTKMSRTRRARLVTEMKDAATPAEATIKSRTRRAPSVTEVKEAPPTTRATKKSRTQRSVTEEAAAAPEPKTRKTRGQLKEENDSVPEAKEKSATNKRSRSIRTNVKESKASIDTATTTTSRTRRAPAVKDEVVTLPISKKTTRGQRKGASESTEEMEVKEKPASRKRSRPIKTEEEASVTKSRARSRRASPVKDEDAVEETSKVAKKKKVQEEKLLDAPRSLRRKR